MNSSLAQADLASSLIVKLMDVGGQEIQTLMAIFAIYPPLILCLLRQSGVFTKKHGFNQESFSFCSDLFVLISQILPVSNIEETELSVMDLYRLFIVY